MSALSFLRAINRSRLMGFVNIHQFYCDESGKYQKDPLTAFCGMCAIESRIREFDEEWRALLLHFELDALHMKKLSRTHEDCGARFPKGQTIPEKIELLKPFADCINKYMQIGLIQAWDVKGYNALKMDAKKLLGGSHDPYFLTFIRGMLELIDHVPEQDRIALICDDDLNNAWVAYLHYRAVGKAEGKIQQRMVAITFANDVYFPALQAADMLAFLTRQEGAEKFYGHANSWKPLYKYLVTEPEPSKDSMRWYGSYQDEASMVDLANALQGLVDETIQK
jgi:Protein of unknown function (DUF3800)